MERKAIVFSLFAIALGSMPGASAVLSSQAPATVSPGEITDFARVLGPCPTFSWGEVDGSSSFELAVYEVEDGLEAAQPHLMKELPGSVESFTPALASCPRYGGRYAWSVRAIGHAGPSEWAPLRLFEVGSVTDATGSLDDAVTPTEEALLTTEAAPVLGAQGVDQGAGAPTPPRNGFVDLSVEGAIEAGFFQGSGALLTNVTAAAVICSGCVGSTDIGSSAVGSSEIASGAVGSSEIATSAVRGAELPTLRIVSVECEGECSDNTLSELCNFNTSGFEPLAVDCQNVDSDAGFDSACGGGGDNRCSSNTVFGSSPLSNYCDDSSGWDANVYCISTN